ncbi:MAG: TatD family hydrolase [Proteobacteria bacterium]|nr:TatD family hydrolase [Pseudomonadota bacterium]
MSPQGGDTAMRIVDSHCHLDFDSFEGDLEEVVKRARDAGVCRMITICTKISAFDAVLAIAERFDDVFCSVGVHPHEAEREGDVTLERLVQLAGHPKVVGIGESGLDYFYDNAPREAQKASFLNHIQAARETGLPLIVHSRDADEDMAEMLEEGYRQGPFPGLLHCFTAGPELARRAVAIGFYVSLAGIITFKSAESIRQTVAMLPADRLLVETDAPYLAPVPMRGKRNEPAFVRHTHAALASVKAVDEAVFAEQTTENFLRLFSKVSRPAEMAGKAG